jgi:hypothetical protein
MPREWVNQGLGKKHSGKADVRMTWQQPQMGPREKKGKPGKDIFGYDLGPMVPKGRKQNVNYGLRRADEVHLRNAERRALKEQAKLQGRVFDEHLDRVVTIDRRRNHWHDNILRSVVYSVAGNAPIYYVPQYQPAYVYQEPSFYSYESYGPQYYYPGTVVTTYDFYEPYSYSYSGYSSVVPYYDTSSYYGSYYPDVLDMPYLSGSSGFGDVVNRLFSQLVAYGYEQGYRDASIARSTGYVTEYFSDPYDPYVYVDPDVAFNDVGYDPYSCLGQNRRYISDGYELGYRDALYGESVIDPIYDDTNVDLVSALISSVLGVS